MTVRVPIVIANQVLAPLGHVLGDFGEEIQGAQDPKITTRYASQVPAGRSGKMAAVVLLYSADHRAVVGQTAHARQAEGTGEDVFGQALQTCHVARHEVHAVINTEAVSASSSGRHT